MNYTTGTVVFDSWEIIRLIGEGSYGKVYEIRKTEYGITTISALKVISIPKSQAEIIDAYNDGMDDQSVTAYFKGFVDEIVKEILIMSKVKSHNNVVSYEDHKVIEHEGSIGWDILIRMEYLTPFVDYMYRNKLSEADVVRLGLEISSALEYCHSKGLIHRDIKPENILVNDAGVFKIGDFGVARTVEKTSGMSKRGTEVYMAPEVYLGKPYGISVDTYSLGLVLYRLLNGNRLPFLPLAPNPITFEDKENALIKRMKGEKIEPPINASEELGEVVLKACAFEPENRFKSTGELNAALTATSAKIREKQNEIKEEDITKEDIEPIEQVERDNIDTIDKTIGIWGTSSAQEKIGETLVEDENCADEFKTNIETTNSESLSIEKANEEITTIPGKRTNKKIFIIIGAVVVLGIALAVILVVNKFGNATIEDNTIETTQSVVGENIANTNNNNIIDENIDVDIDVADDETQTESTGDGELVVDENLGTEIAAYDNNDRKVQLTNEQANTLKVLANLYEEYASEYKKKKYHEMSPQKLIKAIQKTDDNFQFENSEQVITFEDGDSRKVKSYDLFYGFDPVGHGSVEAFEMDGCIYNSFTSATPKFNEIVGLEECFGYYINYFLKKRGINTNDIEKLGEISSFSIQENTYSFYKITESLQFNFIIEKDNFSVGIYSYENMIDRISYMFPMNNN